MQARADAYPLWELGLPILADISCPDPPEPAPNPPPSQATPASESDHGLRLVEEAQAEAQRIVQEAQAEAERILAHAEAEIQERAQRAQEAAAQALAREQEAILQELWEALRAALMADFERRWTELEEEAARLCLDLAESILRKKIAEDDEVVVRTVREGLASIRGVREVTVRVSPQEERRVREAAVDLLADLPGTVELVIVDDPTVSEGGALVQSSHGEVDLRIDSQLARLRAAAENALRDLR